MMADVLRDTVLLREASPGSAPRESIQGAGTAQGSDEGLCFQDLPDTWLCFHRPFPNGGADVSTLCRSPSSSTERSVV